MFKKIGIILDSKSLKWVKGRLWVPTAFKINKSKIIIFFAGQRKDLESDVGYFIYDIKKNIVTKVSNKPILVRGKLGSFDDSAVVPCQIIKIRSNFFLYYVGWMQGKKVPYLPSLGLAVSKNLLGPYKKYSHGPIIEKNNIDPFFVASCFVEKLQKNFIMHYTSCTGWTKKNNIIEPRYIIKNSFSINGVNWIRKNKISINFKNGLEKAITRPWIINFFNKKIMFYSLKKRKYEIKVAKYFKNRWKTLNINIFKNSKKTHYDNESNEYASVVESEGKYFMFYNGNQYGKTGIALAISDEKTISKYI